MADPRDRLVDDLAARYDFDERTLAALRAVPRHAFVPSVDRERAYADRPLPIGEEQTISAPHAVGLLVDALDLDPGERVLEVGTGCGYHAAVTAEVVGPECVYTVERHPRLAREAGERLAELGYGAVSVRVGDGAQGWPARAPFDAAYLTCAAPDFPDPVRAQVRPGGRVLGPLGDDSQELVLARRTGSGLDRESLGPVRFVPLRDGVAET